MKRSVRPQKQQFSLYDRLRLALGYTYVPQNYILIVKRDGKVDRFLDAGFHYILRMREVAGDEIRVGMRKPLDIDGLSGRSLDGMPFVATVRVLYKFDPRRCADKQLAAQLALAPDLALAGLVTTRSGVAVRATLGRYEEAELRRGATWEELQSLATEQLQRKLGPLGFQIIDEVVISAIDFDETTEQLNQSAIAWRNFARTLENLPDEDAEQIYETERMKRFGEGGGQMRLSRSDEANRSKRPQGLPKRGRRTGRRPGADDH